MKSLLALTLNGRRREDAVGANTLLLDYVRDVAGLTGTKQGCDGGECGACGRAGAEALGRAAGSQYVAGLHACSTCASGQSADMMQHARHALERAAFCGLPVDCQDVGYQAGLEIHARDCVRRVVVDRYTGHESSAPVPVS